MRRIQLSGASVALSATGFVSNATGATWTLSATSVSDGLAHLVTIHNDSATDHSAKTALLTGTDPNGNPQTETLSLPAGTATVTSTKYFLTLTSVVPSATIGADTMDVGYTAASVTPTYYSPNLPFPQFNIGFGCTVVSGSPTYTVQHTYDGSAWFSHSVVASKTQSADGVYTSPIAGLRLSWAAAGSVSLTGFQLGT